MLHGFCNFDRSKVYAIILCNDLYVTVNMSMIDFIDKRQSITAGLFNRKSRKPAVVRHS